MHRPYILSIHTKSNGPRTRIAASNSINAVNFSFGTHNETLSVIAVCIDNRDCSHSRIALLDWITVHSSLITLLKGGLATPEAWRRRAVSSVVEHLVYTERVGGSKPSPPILFQWRVNCEL